MVDYEPEAHTLPFSKQHEEKDFFKVNDIKLGAKVGVIAGPAIIAQAIENALGTYGIKEFPISPKALPELV